MKVFRDPFGRTDLPSRPVLAIGNFDGVHRGHRAILEETVRRARSLDAPAAALTFDPHPLRILAPEVAPAMLQTLRQKERELLAIGLDAVLVVPFTRDFSLIPAAEFVRELLCGALGVREIVIGRSFSFGHGRGGDLALLEALGTELGFVAHGVADVVHDGAPISSTRIRRAVLEGKVEDASAMLDRPFGLEGIVTRGEQVGRKLGFPTLNLLAEGELVPARGVYVTELRRGGEAPALASVTNVGTRPTLEDEREPTIETFVLDFDQDVYGERVHLDFRVRLREERRFSSLAELAQAIGHDVERTRAWFRAKESEAPA